MTTQEPGDAARGLVLLTRPDCHLCDDARSVVSRVAAELHIPWQEQDISGDTALEDRFSEEVPVVMIDGVQRDFWRIDEARLRRLLAERAPGVPRGDGK